MASSETCRVRRRWLAPAGGALTQVVAPPDPDGAAGAGGAPAMCPRPPSGVWVTGFCSRSLEAGAAALGSCCCLRCLNGEEHVHDRFMAAGLAAVAEGREAIRAWLRGLVDAGMLAAGAEAASWPDLPTAEGRE